MGKQIVFACTLLITLGIFAWTVSRIAGFLKLTRPAFPVRNLGKRLWITFEVAFLQSKIFRRPIIGFLHALVFWGFCVILIGSVEMVIDGLSGSERILSLLGVLYDVIIASGDIFALLITFAIIVFLSRRLFFHIKRFEGVEMKPVSHKDANLALSMILLLMLTLLGINASYVKYQLITGGIIDGVYPVGALLSGLYGNISQQNMHVMHEFF